MTSHRRLNTLIAERLLKISAIKLQPDMPFTWASGWSSPIYIDNRKALSYPQLRTIIKTELARVVVEEFAAADAIAGVATGAIAQGALLADTLALPFAYVRSTPKDHGLENLIEGNLTPGRKVVVVEDVVSTGANSLKAVDAIRAAGCEVLGMVCIFTFEFPVAADAFKKAGVKLIPLTTFSTMINTALDARYINTADAEMFGQWRSDPANWFPAID